MRLLELEQGRASLRGSLQGSRQLRNQVRGHFETIRRLRNRVAHHEPIFTRNLAQDLNTIMDLIEMRSRETAELAHILEDVTQILSERP